MLWTFLFNITMCGCRLVLSTIEVYPCWIFKLLFTPSWIVLIYSLQLTDLLVLVTIGYWVVLSSIEITQPLVHRAIEKKKKVLGLMALVIRSRGHLIHFAYSMARLQMI